VTPLEGVLVVAAGVAAGTINTVVGSGSLVTFPCLLAVGYPALVANVSNTIGLVPGSLSGSWGYRRELAGQRRRVLVLGTASTSGGITGAVLLLALPGDVFEVVVPILILAACGLMLAQPRIARHTARRRALAADTGAEDDGKGGSTADAGTALAGTGVADTGAEDDADAGTSLAGARPERTSKLLVAGVYAAGVYGGYFGAAQGVILLALLGILVVDDLQRLNALKNVLATFVNGVAALVFAVTSDVAWEAAGLLAVGAAVGGQVGAAVGRRIPAGVLRVAVVAVGVVVAITFWA
jgi:hypothetical protein